MANSAENVFVAGGNGAIAHAPLATTLPEAFDDALDNAFVAVGYISEDGVTEKQNRETKQIKAWQNGDVVRTVQTGHSLIYEFTMIERNEETLAMFYGATDPDAIEVSGAVLGHEAFVIEALDGSGIVRIVIPDGQITDTKEVAYKASDPAMFGVTIECYPDDDGVKSYIYSGTELS